MGKKKDPNWKEETTIFGKIKTRKLRKDEYIDPFTGKKSNELKKKKDVFFYDVIYRNSLILG